MPREPGDIPDALLRLALCPAAGPAFHHDALLRFGSFEGAVAASADELVGLGRTSPERAAEIHRGIRDADPDAEREAMRRAGLTAIALGDADYPPLLVPVPTPPVLLWTRGRAAACAEDSAAIVGARRATSYGEVQAARFSAALASEGIAVVSGGARGVDAAAHRAALRVGGTTVAVLGSGLGEAYPPEHAELYESIAEAGGLLVSEFPTHWSPLASNFPRRNRIISGLSLTVLVVEAGTSSGALITARHAVDDHQREPCALPGPVDSVRSAGCNAAIRDGWAQCVIDPEDVLAMIESSAERLRMPSAVRPDLAAIGVPAELRAATVRAAELIARRPRIGDDAIAADVGLAASEVAAVRTFAELLLATVASARAGRSRRTQTLGPRGRTSGNGQVQPIA